MNNEKDYSEFWRSQPYFETGADGSGEGDAGSGNDASDSDASGGTDGDGKPDGDASGGDGGVTDADGKQTDSTSGDSPQSLEAANAIIANLQGINADLGKTVGKQSTELGVLRKNKIKALDAQFSGNPGSATPTPQAAAGQVVLTAETLPAFVESIKNMDKGGEGQPGSAGDPLLSQTNYITGLAGQMGDFLVDQRVQKNFTNEEQALYEPIMGDLGFALTGDPERGVPPSMTMREVLMFAARGANHKSIIAAAEKRGYEKYEIDRKAAGDDTLPTGGHKPSSDLGAPVKRESRIVQGADFVKKQAEQKAAS